MWSCHHSTSRAAVSDQHPHTPALDRRLTRSTPRAHRELRRKARRRTSQNGHHAPLDLVQHAARVLGELPTGANVRIATKMEPRKCVAHNGGTRHVQTLWSVFAAAKLSAGETLRVDKAPRPSTPRCARAVVPNPCLRTTSEPARFRRHAPGRKRSRLLRGRRRRVTPSLQLRARKTFGESLVSEANATDMARRMR